MKYLTIAIAGLFIGFFLKSICPHKTETPQPQIKFHYLGNIRKYVDLEEDSTDKGAYVEHNTVKNRKDGIIRSPYVAARIGELIGNSIYGKNDMHLPINVNLYNNYWWVSGTLPKGMLGGVATISLDKSNCMIVHISHSK